MPEAERIEIIQNSNLVNTLRMGMYREVLKSREHLLKKVEEYKKKFPDPKNVPRPSHWSGWCLIPHSIEFWLRGENRIHERLKYDKSINGWNKIMLNP